jgi:hypothetical protein
MGVNRPSVEASDLTTMGKFVPHATSRKKKKKKKKKRQERGVEGGQMRQRSQEGRNRKDSGKIYKVIDKQRRRRVTFVLDF